MRNPAAPAALAAAALLLAACGSDVIAQDAPPTVGVTSSGKAVTVSGAQGLRPGPVRFELRAATRRPRDLTIARLKSGVTKAELTRALPAIVRSGDFRRLRRYVVLAASGSANPAEPYRTTVNLAPGRYLAADTTSPDPRKNVFEPFTVTGEAGTATRPRPDARVEMFDYGYQVNGPLPRTGTLRFENRGRQLHFTLAAPLRPGANARRIKRQLRNPRFDAEKLPLAGPPDQPIGLVSPGTENDVEYSFPTAGRYLFVCFYGDSGSRGRPHSQLGMARVVSVR